MQTALKYAVSQHMGLGVEPPHICKTSCAKSAHPTLSQHSSRQRTESCLRSGAVTANRGSHIVIDPASPPSICKHFKGPRGICSEELKQRYGRFSNLCQFTEITSLINEFSFAGLKMTHVVKSKTDHGYLCSGLVHNKCVKTGRQLPI